MTERNPLMANRVRKIAGSLAFIEHRQWISGGQIDSMFHLEFTFSRHEEP